MPFRHNEAGTEIVVGASKYSRQWFSAASGEITVASTGAALWHGTPYRDQALAAFVADLLLRGLPMKGVLLRLNGQFALISINGDKVIAAVDRVRSIPLFYRCSSPPRIVTDDIETIRCLEPAPALDNIQSSFFLKTGYTLGRTTLLEGVSQLLPGEFLTCRGGCGEVEQYYVHFAEEQLTLPGGSPFEDLDAVSERVFRNTIAILDGRQAVVPLSGGYDSRYILTGLKDQGCENVLAFTYGRTNSPEVEMARQVVSALGLPWRRIEYSADRWRRFLSSDRFSDFFHRSFQFSSLPCLQEFLAVEELAESGDLDDSAVFLPGYCGDLLGGSYVPESLSEDPSGTSLLEAGIEDYSFQRHLVLNNRIDPAISRYLREIGSDTFARRSIEDIESFVSTSERWFVEHKVSKFVVNAVRTYEHFGYDWYLPLWDVNLIDYWYSVKLSKRVGACRLYDKYLLDHYFAKHQVNFSKSRPMGHLINRRKIQNAFGEEFWKISRAIFHSLVRRSRHRDVNLFTVAGARLSRMAESIGSEIDGGSDMNSALARFALGSARVSQVERDRRNPRK